MTLFQVVKIVQTIDTMVMSLPDMGEVLDGFDAHELETERAGGAVPRDSINTLRPIIAAVADLQKVCTKQRADYAERHAKPEVSLG